MRLYGGSLMMAIGQMQNAVRQIQWTIEDDNKVRELHGLPKVDTSYMSAVILRGIASMGGAPHPGGNRMQVSWLLAGPRPTRPDPYNIDKARILDTGVYLFECLEAAENLKNRYGVSPDDPRLNGALLHRDADVFETSTNNTESGLKFEARDRADEKARQAEGIAAGQKIINARAVRALHDQIRGNGQTVERNGTRVTSPETIIEVDAPPSIPADHSGDVLEYDATQAPLTPKEISEKLRRELQNPNPDGELGAGNTVIGPISVPGLDMRGIE